MTLNNSAVSRSVARCAPQERSGPPAHSVPIPRGWVVVIPAKVCFRPVLLSVVSQDAGGGQWRAVLVGSSVSAQLQLRYLRFRASSANCRAALAGSLRARRLKERVQHQYVRRRRLLPGMPADRRPALSDVCNVHIG